MGSRRGGRALEKAGFSLLDERELNTGDPSDTGVSAVYGLARVPPGSASASRPAL